MVISVLDILCVSLDVDISIGIRIVEITQQVMIVKIEICGIVSVRKVCLPLFAEVLKSRVQRLIEAEFLALLNGPKKRYRDDENGSLVVSSTLIWVRSKLMRTGRERRSGKWL